jgi:hypothetical protein
LGVGIAHCYLAVPKVQAFYKRVQAAFLLVEAETECDRVRFAAGGGAADDAAVLTLLDQALSKYEEALELRPKSDVTFHETVLGFITAAIVTSSVNTSASASCLKKAASLCEAKLEQDYESVPVLALFGSVLQIELLLKLFYGLEDYRHRRENIKLRCLFAHRIKISFPLSADSESTRVLFST